MKKERLEKRLAYFHSTWLPAFALFLALSLSLPAGAFAQCEPASDTPPPLAQLGTTDINNLNLLITQEESFVDNIMKTAFKDLANYYFQFAQTVEGALSNWAAQDFYTNLKGMTNELHAAQVDQSYRLGQLMDAQLLVEQDSQIKSHDVDAHRRYAPSELACEIDSTGPGMARAFQIARAFNRGLALDDAPRHENATNTTSALGKGAEVNSVWQEYVTKFCDNTMGDQGCTAPGTVAGMHKNIGAFLWGPKQTIDNLNLSDTRLALQASLRYFVDPLASDPIPPQAATSADGHAAILARHAELAYTNAIYNTLGAMLGERIGGSGVDVRLLRSANGSLPIQPTDPIDSKYLGGGVLLANTSSDASYREIQEAMTRDRFDSPNYLLRLIGSSSQVAREQTTLNALRLQTMNDIFRRTEEMLFMESAEYGRDLNSQIPHSTIINMPLH